RRRLLDGDLGGEREGRGRGTGRHGERARLERPATVGPVLEDALWEQDPDVHRLTGIRVDRGETGQPLGRALHRGVRAGRVDLHHLAAGPGAGIAHGHAYADAGSVGRHRDRLVRPAGIAVTVAEREQRLAAVTVVPAIADKQALGIAEHAVG